MAKNPAVDPQEFFRNPRDQRRVWLQGAENRLWAYARDCLSAGQAKILLQPNNVEQLLTTGKPLAAILGPRAWNLLHGQVRAIGAAAALALGNTRADAYLEEAAAAYDQAFSSSSSTDKPSTSPRIHAIAFGEAIANRAVRWLRNDVPDSFSAQTWFLLAIGQNAAIQVTACLEPGTAAALLPDVVALGIVGFDDELLVSLRQAWTFISANWPCPAASQVVWGFRNHADVERVCGDSGGVAWCAVFRAAIEKVVLDSACAVSATLSADGSLGRVLDADSKCITAKNVGCDEVLFAPTTVWDHNLSNRSHAAGVAVADFNTVWERLSSAYRYIAAYQAHWRKHFEDQWSNAAEWANKDP